MSTANRSQHSCDPDRLANYFGANEAAPHYLTPVWFKRDVLVKYYNDPGKFSVEDGYLRCGSLWGLRMDNNVPDYVVVYLGDLGRDLNVDEQTYWRTFNVTPGGRKPSETNFLRAFAAQFTDPSEPDHLFKQRYTQLNEAWVAKFQWPLYRQLHKDDAHIPIQFHLPISEAVGEFDSQLLYLVKLLIDSLNEAELAKIGGADAGDKGITKFEKFLKAKNYVHVDRDISILRTLQNLRSTGAAHAKGKSFDKVQRTVGLDQKSPKLVFRNLLDQVNQMLSDISAHVVLGPSDVA